MALGLASTYAQNVLNSLFHNTAFPTLPNQWWVKFHIGDPGAAGTANPALNTTRYQATFGAASASGTTASVTNSAQISLGTIATTETYSHFSLWTSSSGGNLLATGQLFGGSVTAGTQANFPQGALGVTITIAAT